MSRVIVKNLPKEITSEKLHNAFETKGFITDLQLKYTKDGKFRQFAFIGFKTEDEAKAAKEYFNDTYILSSKIKVEVCSNLSDSNKLKVWSKYSKKQVKHTESKNAAIVANEIESTSTLQEGVLVSIDKPDKKSRKSKKEKLESSAKSELNEFPGELQNDTLFAEFLALSKKRSEKPVWQDDGNVQEENVVYSEDSSDDAPDNVEEDPDMAKNIEVSDMEYFKTKVKNAILKDDATGNKSEKQKSKNKPKKKKVYDESLTIKLCNLPFRCKKNQIKKFLQPLKPISLRLARNMKGVAYIMFKTEKELKQALNKDKLFLDGNKVRIAKYQRKVDLCKLQNEAETSCSVEDKAKNLELLAESGRIYVRNLCFSVTEGELEKLFVKFGPLAEIHVPIDSHTKNGLGFAFISYVFAEQAVKAFTELDGTIFQGRVLHLIPAEPKKEKQTDTDGLSFKKKKEAQQKALSGSSHNWNTLFLGLNAVADVMSKKYNIDKSDLLSSNSKESIPVRMALGETQIVVETRKFLLDHGVQLDAFSQPNAERSKTVIVAKNLPANTPPNEIHDIFSRHGIVSRVILPPSGITALIEFQETTEAKSAFKKLAYSRFHHVPLYLEWAPMDALKEVIPDNEDNVTDKSVEESADNASEPEPECTLFVKNLNFKTTEESLQKHFKRCGPLHFASVSKKMDTKSGTMLSMGFGFVQFKKKASAKRALQELQLSELDGHKLEIKFSNRATLPKAESTRRKAVVQEQKSTKILVRNIPFEVTEKEVRDLFKEFGNLRTVRLPKKMEGTHRGFGFVDFTEKNNAKMAFDALCHSTHLLGRRLVLEWANTDSEDVSQLRRKTARDYFPGGTKAKVTKSKLLEDVMLASSKTVSSEVD